MFEIDETDQCFKMVNVLIQEMVNYRFVVSICHGTIACFARLQILQIIVIQLLQCL